MKKDDMSWWKNIRVDRSTFIFVFNDGRKDVSCFPFKLHNESPDYILSHCGLNGVSFKELLPQLKEIKGPYSDDYIIRAIEFKESQDLPKKNRIGVIKARWTDSDKKFYLWGLWSVKGKRFVKRSFGSKAGSSVFAKFDKSTNRSILGTPTDAFASFDHDEIRKVYDWADRNGWTVMVHEIKAPKKV